MNIYTFIFLVIVFGVVVLAINAFFERDEKPRLPDLPGVFTPEQVECLFRMKAQYGAKLDDLPNTNSDDDYTQMNAW